MRQRGGRHQREKQPVRRAECQPWMTMAASNSKVATMPKVRERGVFQRIYLYQIVIKQTSSWGKQTSGLGSRNIRLGSNKHPVEVQQTSGSGPTGIRLRSNRHPVEVQQASG
jgi:hypothetical protein